MSEVQAIITMSVPTLAIGIFIDGLLIARFRRQMDQTFDQTIRRMDQRFERIDQRLRSLK